MKIQIMRTMNIKTNKTKFKFLLYYYYLLINIFKIGDYFIDVQKILKTPVFDNATGDVISSIAFDKLRQKPTSEDILSVIDGQYPVCIMQDETHFNDKGLKLVAQTILQEADAIEQQL